MKAKVSNWLFETRNNGNCYEREKGISSLKEFKLKIIYICIAGAMENEEAYLSYEDICILVKKYSAGMFDLNRSSMNRLVNELVEVGAITKTNDMQGKIGKNLYKLN